MVLELKQYVDMTKESEMQPFFRTVEDWERSQPEGTKVLKKTYPTHSNMYRQGQTSQMGFKKSISGYHCAKVTTIS